ncbi:DNA-3-methyladenine glycosylase I [Leucobacter sp. cx-42]|uniref:DNA-3-methyladenine glycosylase I n=1 Tax=unclassified Leucobacter TaxID=2621730 RepID=UPI00165E8042|nr:MULTISPECIES: DNA-3-methyladenine glycosylase I [unclassified Leucobacter]MBC9955178.1 DNA-3-methyladenine glycosylase I [Leucobacter sp. cx-42]
MNTYQPASDVVRTPWAEQDPLLTEYYDTEWGMPVRDERGLFERISLEGFQSGLSWLTVLRKREVIRAAFHHFEIERVAQMNDEDIERILEMPGMIRNRLKVKSVIHNAQLVMKMWHDGETLNELVWNAMPEVSPAPETENEIPASSPESVVLAKALKKRGFRYVGPVTVYALMTAIGVVDGHIVSSHRRGCSGLWNIDGTRTRV